MLNTRQNKVKLILNKAADSYLNKIMAEMAKPEQDQESDRLDTWFKEWGLADDSLAAIADIEDAYLDSRMSYSPRPGRVI